MVDAAEIAAGQTGAAENGALRETAEYLYNVLVLLQKRASNVKTSRGPNELPLLIAANKLDLFTALPAALIKTKLENEISKIRISRSKGLLDSGIGMNEMDEEKEWLGDGGEGKFEFAQMQEFNISVKVIGGNVMGSDGPEVKQWWAWIGSNI